jgi:DNA repair protein RecN (Recombination protein N)
MITHLSIEGLAIIESLSIEFSPGFNVITGETGAGKSILIRALHFLMGGKASADTVRQGSPAANVSGQFWVPKGHCALSVLESLGIPYEGQTGVGHEILIRRQLTNKGRAQAWINDIAVTSTSLREVGITLVDVFGQHENQRLMDSAQHINYIDDFLELPQPREKVEELSRNCQKCLAEVQTLIETYHSRSRSRDYFSFRMEELEKFAPSREDYDRIVLLSQRAESVLSVKEVVTSVIQLLDGSDDGPSVSAMLREVSKQLSLLGDEGELLKASALEVCNSVDSLNYEVSKFASGFDIDEKELEGAQSRIFGYQELFRKHGVRDVDSLVSETNRLKTELEFLNSAEEELEESLTRLRDDTLRLRAAAQELTKSRAKAAKTIKKTVESELQELAMPGASLSIEFTPMKRNVPELDLSLFREELRGLWNESATRLSTVGEKGAERGQFLLASNPGEPALALNRVASGGELSRIMLALKKALVADAETCVLVFDEIDTGISGRVADVVGRKMRELANNFQVICISHLPQVAVYADTHFLVHKGGKKTAKRTETTIVRLSKEESAQEIARLLSGAEVSKVSLANAKSMIAKALSMPRQM